jgi:hypothetical protein
MSGAEPHRTHVPGYKSVLINEKLKDKFTNFRRNEGLVDSQMERCLVSAAVSLLMKNREWQKEWMDELKAMLAEDAKLVIGR